MTWVDWILLALCLAVWVRVWFVLLGITRRGR